MIGGFKKLAEAFYWSKVKTCAVQSKKLTPLWCEDQLCGSGPWIREGAKNFEDVLMEGPEEARVRSNKLLLDNKGSSIKVELQKSAKILKFTDDHFDIEASFFGSMLGTEGARILLDKCKAHFSTEGGRRPSLQEVAQHLEVLVASKLYKFAPDSAQNELSIFNKTIQGMLLGEQPVLKANATQVVACPVKLPLACFCFRSFPIYIYIYVWWFSVCQAMKNLHALLPSLLSWSASAFSEVQYGKIAWQSLFPGLQGVESLEGMEQFRIFSFLGSADDKKAVKEQMQKLLKELTEGGAEVEKGKKDKVAEKVVAAAKAGGKKTAAAKASGS